MEREKFWRKRLVLFFSTVGLVIALVLGLNKVFDRSETELDKSIDGGLSSARAGNPDGKSSRQVRSDRKEKFSRSDFLKNADNVEFLERNLAYALSEGFLRDQEIALLYLRKLSRLSVDTLAILSLAEDTCFSASRIYQTMIVVKDLAFLKDYFALIRENSNVSSNFLQHLGSDFEGIKDSEIPAFVNGFSNLSKLEASGFASGLASRLKRKIGPEDRLEIIDRIFDGDHDVRIFDKLGSLVVETLGNEDSFEWLIANKDREAMEGADRQFMRSAVESQQYEQASSLVEKLLDDGQILRAQKAVESFLPSYASGNSENALQWIESLDGEFVTNQMRATVFVSQYKEDPERAELFVNSQPDPKMREFYSRMLEWQKK